MKSIDSGLGFESADAEALARLIKDTSSTKEDITPHVAKYGGMRAILAAVLVLVGSYGLMRTAQSTGVDPVPSPTIESMATLEPADVAALMVGDPVWVRPNIPGYAELFLGIYKGTSSMEGGTYSVIVEYKAEKGALLQEPFPPNTIFTAVVASEPQH